jgi:hypothetical protein
MHRGVRSPSCTRPPWVTLGGSDWAAVDKTRLNFQMDLFTPDDGHYDYSAVPSSQIHLRLCLLQPEAHVYLAVHRTARFARPSPSMTFKELFHDREEVFHLDRFALEGVEPCVQHPLPVPGHHRRGHRHNGNPPSGNLGLQPAERLDSIDPGSRMSIRIRLGRRSRARSTPSSPVSASMISYPLNGSS